MLSPDRLAELDAFLLELNRASAEEILPLFRSDHGLEDKGGLLRIGATHYNTVDEIHHLGEVLREIVRG